MRYHEAMAAQEAERVKVAKERIVTEEQRRWIEKAKAAYNPYKSGRYWISDYQPMLDSFGEIVAQVDEEDYQGDSWVLYRDGDRFGFLTFGWGSCSGCDSLQACGDNLEEVGELMEQLQGSIIWHGSASEMAEYFNTKDFTVEFYASSEYFQRFFGEAQAVLAKARGAA